MKSIVAFFLGSTAATVLIFLNENRKPNIDYKGLTSAQTHKTTTDVQPEVTYVEAEPETYEDFIRNAYFD